MRNQDEEENENTCIIAKDENTPSWSSPTAMYISLVGSAIGTGNIWRFPRILAKNSGQGGSLMFLLVWNVFLVLWSWPMTLLEYATGRYCRTGLIAVFARFLGPRSVWCATWILVVDFALSAYYTVIIGWCYYYLYRSISFPLPLSYNESSAIFYDFAEDTYWPVFTLFLATFSTGIILTNGVETIEWANFALSPVLLIMQFCLFVWSLTLSHSGEGLKFIFSPDWDTLYDPNMWMDAATQNAFDTGAGTGTLVAYGAYMSKGDGVMKLSVLVPTGNNLVSLICGVTMYSTAFSSVLTSAPNTTSQEMLEILQTSGPGSTGLTFIWLPVLLSSVGKLGRLISVLYFFCLISAGVTSNICFSETSIRSLEDIGFKRLSSVMIVSCLTFICGLPSSMSLNFLTLQDMTWAYALFLSGLMLIFMVVYFGESEFRETIVNDFGVGDWKAPKLWEYMIKFVCPIEAILLLSWWIIYTALLSDSDDSSQQENSDEVTEKNSLDKIIVQWMILMVVTWLHNAALLNTPQGRHWLRKTGFYGAHDYDYYPEEGLYQETSLNSPSKKARLAAAAPPSAGVDGRVDAATRAGLILEPVNRDENVGYITLERQQPIQEQP